MNFDNITKQSFEFAQITMANKSEEQYFEDYKHLKETFNLPLKMKMFFTLLQECYRKNLSSPVSKDLYKKYKKFLSVFRQQTDEQKVRFLYETLKQVKSLLNQKEKDENDSSESDGMDQIKEIQTTCKIKDSFAGLPTWDKKSFKLNRRQLKIRISQGPKQTVFILPHYLMRMSHKHSKTFILQSISDMVEDRKSELYVMFENKLVFDEIYQNILSCIVDNTARELVKLLNQKQQNEEDSTSTTGDMAKASIILTPKVLNQYFLLKDKIMRKLQNCSYNFESIETKLPGTKIGVSRHNKKDRIRIQKIFKQNMKSLCTKISLFHRKRDSKLIEFEILQKFSSNISVSYFKYLFNDQIYEFLTILEQNYSNTECNLIFKGIDNFINKQFVDFISIKLKQTDQNTTVLRLIGIVKSDEKKSNLVVDFLTSLIEPTLMPKSTKEEEFWTVREIENVDMFEPEEFYGTKLENQNNLDLNKRFQEMELATVNSNYIHKRYELEPSEEHVNKYLTQHTLLKGWKFNKNGGVTCTDEEQINEQKKVFRFILSQIGSNLFARKNILNVSFPVTVFRKQSHLQSVARNFSYAPIFFENMDVKTPLERIRLAVAFQISMTNLVISISKPFNPILGETYQGFIDGCPIFFEQVSHHPPICCYLFVGRGYKIHGVVAPKIALGLNCAKGYSPPKNYITFENGDILEFTMNKMIINGLLFGQRTFNFEGVNYVVDQKNKLAAEISYGTQANSAFKKKELTYDSVTGAIYQISNSTEPINGDNFKKDEKDRVAIFEGIWHSELKFDGDKFFDFRNDLPHEIHNHEFPLPSDSIYRADIIEMIKGNIVNSQKEKDFLEEVQRRDKRLREEKKV